MALELWGPVCEARLWALMASSAIAANTETGLAFYAYESRWIPSDLQAFTWSAPGLAVYKTHVQWLSLLFCGKFHVCLTVAIS